MSILNEHGRHGSSSADDDYQIEKSLLFQDTNSPYLHRTPSSNGNKRTWTLSTWCKLADAVSAPAHMTLFGAASGYQTHCMFRNSGGFEFAIGNGSSANYWSATSALFRDYSAWYHVVLAVDTTNGTAADRAKVYINGVRQTAFSTNNTANIPQNFDTCVNHTSHQMRVGAQNTSSNFMDGLLAEYHFIDGQALTPSSFGETDNAYRHWKPKAYTGSYGTDGFYLKF